MVKMLVDAKCDLKKQQTKDSKLFVHINTRGTKSIF